MGQRINNFYNDYEKFHSEHEKLPRSSKSHDSRKQMRHKAVLQLLYCKIYNILFIDIIHAYK